MSPVPIPPLRPPERTPKPRLGEPVIVLSATPMTTIQEARAAGAVEGTMLSAPLAPKEGAITVNVADATSEKTEKMPDGTTVTTPASQPLVVVAVQQFWQSKTIIWLRRLVIAAFGVALLAVIEPYTIGDKTWDTFTMAAVWPSFLHAFEVAVLSAIFAYFKVRDNNPIQK